MHRGCNSYVIQVSQKENFSPCDTWLTEELHKEVAQKENLFFIDTSCS